MKLSIEQIKEITCGAVRIEETDFGVGFFRFTKAQEEMYKERNADFYMKCFSTSGIKLRFTTDSENIFLKGRVKKGCSRRFYSVDVTVNRTPVGHIDNFENVEIPKEYSAMSLELGNFEKNITLGAGQKEVCVYFPWGQKLELSDLSLDDGSTLSAVKYDKKLLAFGDSITHGYDALRNYNKYATKLSEALECEEFNKAIGGEKFVPSLSVIKEDFTPDIITVAYGTNDWTHVDTDAFVNTCSEFFKNLCDNYPHVPVFAITPIWRVDIDKDKKMGAFENAGKHIREICAGYKNIKVINGLELFPYDAAFFSDGVIHPNDEGFGIYFENLFKKIKESL